MKKLFLIALLLSSQTIAHGHHHHEHSHADDAATGFSVLWNGYEIFSHIASLFGWGHAHCCGHSTKAFHVVELVGHGTNLFEGVSHFMEDNTTPTVLSAGSLLFNIWAAHAQSQTIRHGEFSVMGILLAPMAIIDVLGHTTSAYVALKDLAGI